MSIKKWDNWKKVSRESLASKEMNPSKKIKPFIVDSSKHFKASEVKGDVLLKGKEVPINKINQPILCENCGYHILNKDFFYLYTPDKKLVCRGCRQNIKNCLNCKDVIPPHLFDANIPYCSDCKKKNICDCCGELKNINELKRVEKIKGAYCSDCIQKSRACLHCFKKIPRNHIVCKSCFSRKKLSKEEIITLIQNVITFYKNLDPNFYISIHPKNLSITSLENTKELSFFSSSPIVLNFSEIKVIQSITEKDIYLYLSRELTLKHLNLWSKLKSNNAMKKIISIFLIHLFFSENKILVLGEDINDVLPVYRKEYTLLKDLEEKIGKDKTYLRLKGQFGE